MPVYNAAPFLAECLETILMQTYGNWELLAVDDFSTDDSLGVIKAYAANDRRIKPIKNKEKGIIPALTVAFNKSSGQLITRMDADDRMTANKLQILESAFKPGKTIVTGKVKYFSSKPISQGYLDYENWLNERVDYGDHWAQVYRECVIASPNWLVDRSCFEDDICLDTLAYPEDYDMTLRWYDKGYKVITSPEITHEWREHPDRTSSNDNAYQQASFFELKTKCFIEYELKRDEPVQLLGAGKKGKLVAKILTKNEVPFQWFDVNAVDYVNGLMGKKILPLSSVMKGKKSILTAWPKEVNLRRNIRTFLKENDLELGVKCWLF